MSCELAFVSWPPLRLARLRCERGSVGVVSPAAPIVGNQWGDAHATSDRHRCSPNIWRGSYLGEWHPSTCRPARHDTDRSHVLDHATAQRAHRGHLETSCLMDWACAPTILPNREAAVTLPPHPLCRSAPLFVPACRAAASFNPESHSIAELVLNYPQPSTFGLVHQLDLVCAKVRCHEFQGSHLRRSAVRISAQLTEKFVKPSITRLRLGATVSLDAPKS